MARTPRPGATSPRRRRDAASEETPSVGVLFTPLGAAVENEDLASAAEVVDGPLGPEVPRDDHAVRAANLLDDHAVPQSEGQLPPRASRRDFALSAVLAADPRIARAGAILARRGLAVDGSAAAVALGLVLILGTFSVPPRGRFALLDVPACERLAEFLRRSGTPLADLRAILEALVATRLVDVVPDGWRLIDVETTTTPAAGSRAS